MERFVVCVVFGWAKFGSSTNSASRFYVMFSNLLHQRHSILNGWLWHGPRPMHIKRSWQLHMTEWLNEAGKYRTTPWGKGHFKISTTAFLPSKFTLTSQIKSGEKHQQTTQDEWFRVSASLSSYVLTEQQRRRIETLKFLNLPVFMIHHQSVQTYAHHKNAYYLRIIRTQIQTARPRAQKYTQTKKGMFICC